MDKINIMVYGSNFHHATLKIYMVTEEDLVDVNVKISYEDAAKLMAMLGKEKKK